MVRYLFYTIGDLTYQSPLVVQVFITQKTQEKAYNILLHNLFLEFKQAFDNVNRDRMLNDLMILGTQKTFVQLISVTLAGSKATVRVDNQYASTFPITNGVRQGDALSSILFELILEAILQKISKQLDRIYHVALR